jgi:adenine specific DNA methylase Mod
MPGEFVNQLHYGDNLERLRNHIPDEVADLVYLDPPFNSARNYNLLFKQHKGQDSPAQIMAFEDTWQWSPREYHRFQQDERNQPLWKLVAALYEILGDSEMMAYIVMMAPRLLELHRKLKPTGSLYLHCDPTASHYLKLLLDVIFQPIRFHNEIVWKRSSAHNDAQQGMRRYGRIHDVLLFYSKSEQFKWNTQWSPFDADYLESEYRHLTPTGRHYKETDATGAKPGGDTSFLWHVKRPTTHPPSRWVPDLEDEHLNPLEGWEYISVLHMRVAFGHIRRRI